MAQTEIVQTATLEATRLIDAAHAEADRLRGECDIYVDASKVRDPQRNPALGRPWPHQLRPAAGHDYAQRWRTRGVRDSPVVVAPPATRAAKSRSPFVIDVGLSRRPGSMMELTGRRQTARIGIDMVGCWAPHESISGSSRYEAWSPDRLAPTAGLRMLPHADHRGRGIDLTELLRIRTAPPRPYQADEIGRRRRHRDLDSWSSTRSAWYCRTPRCRRGLAGLWRCGVRLADAEPSHQRPDRSALGDWPRYRPPTERRRPPETSGGP